MPTLQSTLTCLSLDSHVTTSIAVGAEHWTEYVQTLACRVHAVPARVVAQALTSPHLLAGTLLHGGPHSRSRLMPMAPAEDRPGQAGGCFCRQAPK